MSTIKGYHTEKIKSRNAIKHLFISKGKSDIIKAIQYHYIQDFSGWPLYNLAFGDYDIFTDRISDDSDSNNGDMYLVFYTVLGTIAVFFETFPTAMLMVQGSDNNPQFEALCRKQCRRRCTTNCKRRNRRITVYRDYVNKNFDVLSKDYIFYGGLDTGNRRIVETYEPAQMYNAVFLRKR